MESRSSMPSFSEADIKKVLGSKEGQALLRLLSRDGGTALKQAAAALKAGNTAQAQNVLKPVLQTSEAAELLQKLTQK